jgi:hypothetical protein
MKSANSQCSAPLYSHHWINVAYVLADLHVQYCNTVILKKSVMNMEISLYNKVPDQIKQKNNFTFTFHGSIFVRLVNV